MVGSVVATHCLSVRAGVCCAARDLAAAKDLFEMSLWPAGLVSRIRRAASQTNKLFEISRSELSMSASLRAMPVCVAHGTTRRDIDGGRYARSPLERTSAFPER